MQMQMQMWRVSWMIENLLRILIYFCRESCILEVHVTKMCCLINNGGCVYCNSWSKTRNDLDETVSPRFWFEERWVCSFLWQLECKTLARALLTIRNEAHWYEIPLIRQKVTDLFILLKKIHIKMNSADKVIKVVTLEKVEFVWLA